MVLTGVTSRVLTGVTSRVLTGVTSRGLKHGRPHEFLLEGQSFTLHVTTTGQYRKQQKIKN